MSPGGRAWERDKWRSFRLMELTSYFSPLHLTFSRPLPFPCLKLNLEDDDLVFASKIDAKIH